MKYCTTKRRLENYSRLAAKIIAASILSSALTFSVGAFANDVNNDDQASLRKLAPIGQLIKEDSSWRIRNAVETLPNGQARIQPHPVMDIVGAEGVANAPIPEEMRNSLIDDLAASPEGETPTYTISMEVVDEVNASIAQGYATSKLEEYIASGEAVVDEAADTLSADVASRRGCSDKNIIRGQRFQKSTPLNTSRDFGEGFSGSLSITGNANVDAYGEVKIRLKRFWFFGCVPYGVRFDHAKITGNANVEQGTTLTGTVNYTYKKPIEWEITTIPLFGFGFLAGPIPVYIGFDMPITAGFDANAINVSVAGSVTYSGSRRLGGNFDYTCTSASCGGSNTFNNINLGDNQPFTAGFSGRFQASIYAQAAFRAYLYDTGVAYAQVGVRPYLHADLWGYYGNNCGDADGDGYFETVDALTLNLDWQLFITAKADTFLTSSWNKNLWESPRWFIGFWDFIGSDALTPMLVGPANPILNQNTVYSARMRPCWPYADTVNYLVNWGDGSQMALSGAPQDNASATHSWPEGNRVLTLTALSDSRGRQFNKVTQRTITAALNKPPVARCEIIVNTSPDPKRFLDVTLNGSYSYDPDGTVASYKWTDPDGVVRNGSRFDLLLRPFQGRKFYNLEVVDNHGSKAVTTCAVVWQELDDPYECIIRNGQTICP